jgi:hypothetical protein
MPRGQSVLRKAEPQPPPLTAQQRLLVLNTWRRSGLPARDFAPLVGLPRHTLYALKQRFEAPGAGLADKPNGSPPAACWFRGSRANRRTRYCRSAYRLNAFDETA